MPWRPINPPDLLARFTVPERNMLIAASGGNSTAMQTCLNDAIAVFNSALLAVGNNVGAAGTMVDSLRLECLDFACWQFLSAFLYAVLPSAVDLPCLRHRPVASPF